MTFVGDTDWDGPTGTFCETDVGTECFRCDEPIVLSLLHTLRVRQIEHSAFLYYQSSTGRTLIGDSQVTGSTLVSGWQVAGRSLVDGW